MGHFENTISSILTLDITVLLPQINLKSYRGTIRKIPWGFLKAYESVDNRPCTIDS